MFQGVDLEKKKGGKWRTSALAFKVSWCAPRMVALQLEPFAHIFLILIMASLRSNCTLHVDVTMFHRTDLVPYPCTLFMLLQLCADHLTGEGPPCTVVGGRGHHVCLPLTSVMANAFLCSIRKFEVDFHRDLCADVVLSGGTTMFHTLTR